MKELAAALCKAQQQIEGAKKDSTNPHFKNKYADLGSVWEACKSALVANGLSVAQFGRLTEHGPALVTRLLHSSGEFIDGEIPLLNGKGDMQGLGSALTYARRYGLAAMVGVSPEDDDGNAASEKREPAKVEPKAAKPAGYDEWRLDFTASADEGVAALALAWKASAAEFRAYFIANEAGTRAELEAKAKKADASRAA